MLDDRLPSLLIPKAEWYVKPFRRAAALPVGATMRRWWDSFFCWKFSTRDFSTCILLVPAIPVMYIFNWSESGLEGWLATSQTHDLAHCLKNIQPIQSQLTPARPWKQMSSSCKTCWQPLHCWLQSCMKKLQWSWLEAWDMLIPLVLPHMQLLLLPSTGLAFA